MFWSVCVSKILVSVKVTFEKGRLTQFTQVMCTIVQVMINAHAATTFFHATHQNQKIDEKKRNFLTVYHFLQNLLHVFLFPFTSYCSFSFEWQNCNENVLWLWSSMFPSSQVRCCCCCLTATRVSIQSNTWNWICRFKCVMSSEYSQRQ